MPAHNNESRQDWQEKKREAAGRRPQAAGFIFALTIKR
jgi:hypothetical protein